VTLDGTPNPARGTRRVLVLLAALALVWGVLFRTSLRALINEDGLIPLDEALAIMVRMAEVVEACHGRGVIHRDLKPEHFLVQGESLKLIDFGLAAIVAGPGAQASLGTGDARGTFDYMAPEQRAGREVGTPADVYALGVCFFEMLADELPRGPQSLKQLRREVPDSVDRAVLSMLAEKPSLRPSLATVLLALRGSDTKRFASGGAAPRVVFPVSVFPIYVWFVLSAVFLAGTSGSLGERLAVVLFFFVVALVAGRVIFDRN
jgi:serine/threonine protein kinase